jgi:hypothetical protein
VKVPSVQPAKKRIKKRSDQTPPIDPETEALLREHEAQRGALPVKLSTLSPDECKVTHAVRLNPDLAQR